VSAVSRDGQTTFTLTLPRAARAPRETPAEAMHT
jgi:hypothetical protein